MKLTAVVADAIINYDNGNEKQIFYSDFMW
jgi:hypothetical protein